MSRTLAFCERETQTKDGAWRLVRIMPYRTHENVIDGLVMTFIDIDRVKRAEEAAQLARGYAEAVVEAVDGALLVVDADLSVVSANRAFLELFGTSRRIVQGGKLQHIADGKWADRAFIEALQRVLSDGETIAGFGLGADFPRPGGPRLHLSARRLKPSSERVPLILITVRQAD